MVKGMSSGFKDDSLVRLVMFSGDDDMASLEALDPVQCCMCGAHCGLRSFRSEVLKTAVLFALPLYLWTFREWFLLRQTQITRLRFPPQSGEQ
jgi:hypothetical protein